MMKYLPNAPKSTAKFWGIILSIPVTFIVIIIFMFVYQGSTKPILDVANKFNPGVGWKLESERVEPPRIICLNSVSCPGVDRIWTYNGEVTSGLIEKIKTNSVVHEIREVDNCTINEMNNGASCSIVLMTSEYYIQIYIDNRKPDSSLRSQLTMFMRKK